MNEPKSYKCSLCQKRHLKPKVAQNCCYNEKQDRRESHYRDVYNARLRQKVQRDVDEHRRSLRGEEEDAS